MISFPLRCALVWGLRADLSPRTSLRLLELRSGLVAWGLDLSDPRWPLCTGSAVSRIPSDSDFAAPTIAPQSPSAGTAVPPANPTHTIFLLLFLSTHSLSLSVHSTFSGGYLMQSISYTISSSLSRPTGPRASIYLAVYKWLGSALIGDGFKAIKSRAEPAVAEPRQHYL
ncbi:hypothetical protein B0H13DRAFT_2388882 [Mycena leptocephala]|nr:hypothetical protein B0H13DRAFT_2388882 [Mycena leptocephala]